MRVLGITPGDVTGIGPEVAIKALQRRNDPDIAWVLIGGSAEWIKSARTVGWNLELPTWPGRALATPGMWAHEVPCGALDGRMTVGDPRAAGAAYAWLSGGAAMCQGGDLDGIVTAPVNKESIQRAGIPFVGQTEVVTEAAGNPPTAMMLLGNDDQGRKLRVMLVTTHLPLRNVAEAITRERILRTLNLATLACRQLGLEHRRIAVCGLNPHAGEGGCIGREEVDVISPAIESARQEGLDAQGPFSADTVFRRAIHGEFEVVVAMYHDQGLAPLKLVAFDTGVNWTVGLPWIRTSPDHGTAYGLAGRGIASFRSMEAAMNLAVMLANPANAGRHRED